MLKLVTENKKSVKEIKGCVYHPEVEMGMHKMSRWLEKKAQEKGLTIVYSYNPIIFKIGLLLKLKGEKVQFFYKNSNGKEEEVLVDNEGFFLNPPLHFMDLEDKIQDEIREIRRQRKYE